MTCKALAERYSRHLGRSLDAMKEVRRSHNSHGSHATTDEVPLVAPGGCDGGRHQCLVPGHAGRSRDILETFWRQIFSQTMCFLVIPRVSVSREAALARPGAGREIVALEPFFELYRSQAMMISGAFMSQV